MKDAWFYFGLALLNVPLTSYQIYKLIHELTPETITGLVALCISIFAIGWCSAFGAASILKGGKDR